MPQLCQRRHLLTYATPAWCRQSRLHQTALTCTFTRGKCVKTCQGHNTQLSCHSHNRQLFCHSLTLTTLVTLSRRHGKGRREDKGRRKDKGKREDQQMNGAAVLHCLPLRPLDMRAPVVARQQAKAVSITSISLNQSHCATTTGTTIYLPPLQHAAAPAALSDSRALPSHSTYSHPITV